MTKNNKVPSMLAWFHYGPPCSLGVQGWRANTTIAGCATALVSLRSASGRWMSHGVNPEFGQHLVAVNIQRNPEESGVYGFDRREVLDDGLPDVLTVVRTNRCINRKREARMSPARISDVCCLPRNCRGNVSTNITLNL